MSTQKLKKGFTLIELMVVIVIIGILAAIAIPKLFGMSAKAKASEVGPAASTYVKLQQAYQVETGLGPGDAGTIGYDLPGTSGKTSNFQYTASTAGTWNADPVNNWITNVNCTGSGTTKKWGLVFSSNITVTNGCSSLTPNFDLLANN